MTARHRTKNTAAYNKEFAIAGVSCFYDNEVLNSSFVHLIKFSAKNPPQCKAQNVLRHCKDDKTFLN